MQLAWGLDLKYPHGLISRWWRAPVGFPVRAGAQGAPRELGCPETFPWVEDQGVSSLPFPNSAFPASFLSNRRVGALLIPSWCLQIFWDLPSHLDKPLPASTRPRGKSKHPHITHISSRFSSAEAQLKKNGRDLSSVGTIFCAR